MRSRSLPKGIEGDVWNCDASDHGLVAMTSVGEDSVHKAGLLDDAAGAGGDEVGEVAEVFGVALGLIDGCTQGGEGIGGVAL